MTSRHTACKLCRDRKVRCPGQQPECEKCRRAGEQCVYLPAQRPTKANLNDTVEALQKRLNEAEALILQMNGHSSSNVGVPSPCSFTWPTNPELPTLGLGDFSGTPNAHPAGASSFPNRLGQQDIIYQQPNLALSEMHCSDGTAHQRGLARSNEFQGTEPMDYDKSPTEIFLQLGLPFSRESDEQGRVAEQHACHGSLPKPTDIPTLVPSSSATGSRFGSIAEETGVVVLDALAGYCSSVVRRECEMAGLATAVADYIAWIRKIPSTGAPPITNSVYQQMMANIEIRVRELIETSQKRHDEPLRDLLGALEGASGGTMAARVARLEDDLQKQMCDDTNFFKTGYDACKLLSEQTQKRP